MKFPGFPRRAPVPAWCGLLLALALWPGSTNALPERLGDFDEDGQATVRDLVRLMNHVRGTTPLPAELVPFADLNQDGQVGQADVDRLSEMVLGLFPLRYPNPAPQVSPAPASVGSNHFVVRGVTLPNHTIRITGGASVVTGRSAADGSYALDVNLAANRLNRLFINGEDPDGIAGPPRTIEIYQDSVPPQLFIDSPPDNAVLVASNVVIAGRVGDQLSGFLGLAVTVGGLPANVIVGIGQNGTYERGAVPLEVGTNLITVTARDVHGNQTSRQLTLRRVAPTGVRLEMISGDAQMTNVHRKLEEPLIVRAVNADGSAFAGKCIDFKVLRSDGRLATGPTDSNYTALSIQVMSDPEGYARVWWQLGSDAGCGNNRVSASSRDVAGTVYFCASANANPASQINIGSGNNQRVPAGQPAPEPLRVWVSDSCNPSVNIPVTFRVIEGGGTVNGASTCVTNTSRTGHAEVSFRAGPDGGNNLIEATFPGNRNGVARFVVQGVLAQPFEGTSFSGVLLNNSSQPIGGAIVNLDVNGEFFEQTRTDLEGQFRFNGTPSGPAVVKVDGLVATHLNGRPIPPGSFPALNNTTTLIPDARNTLPAPILLPPLNPANARVYYGTNDVVLTCEGMAGLKMYVKAGSMRRANGTVPTPANPAVLSLNQVQHDDVPMPMPDGAAPPFAWTLQPGGARFDPPIRVEYPNMTGLPAGSVAYFLTFNHDTERFEIVASGSVSADGALITTDPGAGLSLAGWGCNCPPYSVTGDCEKCDVTCEDKGGLRGGTAKVDKEKAGTGDQITFTADGVTDSGGRKKKVCKKAGTSTENIPAVKPEFEWKITRNGAAYTNGMGPRAEIKPCTNGTFLCEFTVKAVRDCPPDTVKLSKSATVTNKHDGARIHFTNAPAQNFGFDEEGSHTDEYLSCDRAGATTVNVVISPFIAGYYWVTSSDKTKFTVAGDAVLVTSATATIQVTGATPAGDREKAELQVRACDKDGEILKTLNVQLYKKKEIPKLSYYRIFDSRSPGTIPPINPSLADIKNGVNAIYQAAVLVINDVDGSTNKDIAFDVNNNGFIDYYNDGANPEIDAIKNAGLAGSPKIALVVDKFRDNWRLGAAAPAGTNKVTLVDASAIGVGRYRLGSAAGAAEVIDITAINGNVATLATNLSAAHAVTHTVYGSLAGLSTDPQLVTDAGGELIQTIAHEMLHTALFGGIKDVSARDNVMYYTTGATGARMRYRPQTVVKTGTPTPTGATEKQWDKVAR